MTTTKLFCLSWTTHVAHLALVVASIALVRLQALAPLLLKVTSILPNGFYAEIRKPGYYEPLSELDWFVHVATMIPNLEVVYMLYQQRNRSHVYKSLCALFAISHVQGFMTLWSHAMIDHHDDLQSALITWDYFLMRLNVFSTGVLLLSPSTALGYALLPLVAGGIVTDFFVFHTAPGITLSTLSMVAIFVYYKQLSIVFQLAWLSLAFMPFWSPDSSNDQGHTIGAALLHVPLWLMAYGIYMKVGDTGTKGLEKTDIKGVNGRDKTQNGSHKLD